MSKPNNIHYAYPMTAPRTELQVPDYLKAVTGLVVFNVEASRSDDLMQFANQITSLRFLLGDCLNKGLGVVIFAPKKQANHLRDKFPEEIGTKIWLIETDSPHDFRIVDNAHRPMVWVCTCSQANLLSAIGEHKAIMLGYAHGQTQVATSLQKYTCHKVNEYMVGTSSRFEGDVSTFSVDLIVALLNPE